MGIIVEPMTTDLENPFRWSKTRAGTFADCKRKYYLRYYQHWGGWERTASKESRLAYRLGKMVSMPTLKGSAVHEVLADHFRALRNGQFRELKPERPVEKMREVWRNAKDELWRNNPKKYPPLFELYYGRVPPDEELKARAEEARRAVRHLQESDLYRSLCDLDRADFLRVDPVGGRFSEETCFNVPPFEAIAAPDLVYRDRDAVVIVDWKTGKIGDNDRLQMAAGALWARQRLGCEGDELKAKLVYLESRQVEEFALDEEEMDRCAETIHRDMEAMADCLEDRANNIPLDRESFPLHNNKKFCRHCEFQEICYPEGIKIGESEET